MNNCDHLERPLAVISPEGEWHNQTDNGQGSQFIRWTHLNTSQHISTRLNTSHHFSTSLNRSQHISSDLNTSQHISSHLNISHHISTSQHVSMDPKIFQHISSSESFDEILFRCGMKEFERGNLIPRGEPEGEPEIPKYLGILRVIIQM